MTSTGGSGSVVLCTGGFDHTVRLWEAPTGACHRTLPFPDSPINQLTISSDKQFLLVAGNPVLRLFSLQASHASTNQSNNQPTNQSSHLSSFDGHTGAVTGCGFQKSGRWLFSCSEDGTIKVWDARVAHACQRSYTHGCPVTDVALHPNQGELIGCDTEGNLKVWDLTNNQCVKTFTSESSTPLTKLCIANDASQVMAASYKGQVFGWKLNTANNQSINPATNQPINTPYVVLDAHPQYCLKALLSPDCKWLATTSADTTVKIWSTDRSTYQPIKTLTGHTQWVWDCAFSADSAYLVTASSDKVAKLWDREAGECILEYKGHQKAITAIALNDAS